MSKSLRVKKVENNCLELNFNTLKKTFEEIAINKIDISPWETDFPYVPLVSFKIAHSPDYIALYYMVQEEFIKASAMRPNENVWEDSCVEFFLSLDNKNTYYNFEFNSLGIGLIGFGPAVKKERNRLTTKEIETTQTISQIINNQGKKEWEMFILIPKKLFKQAEWSQKTFHANFYKCGDKLPQPHFLAWNPIDHVKPNFHMPEFFGDIQFE